MQEGPPLTLQGVGIQGGTRFPEHMPWAPQAS